MRFNLESARFLNFPQHLTIEANAIANFKKWHPEVGLNIALVADTGVRFMLDDIRKQVSTNNQVTDYLIDGATLAEVAKLDAWCASHQISHMIAIGGGRVLDVCKKVSASRAVHLIVYPTALSSDCIASPISVLLDTQNRKQSLPSKIPDEIIIDSNVVSKCPVRLLAAGYGDLISNHSAILDMQYAKQVHQQDFDYFSKILAHNAIATVESIANLDELLLPSNCAKLAEGLIVSGMAMGFSGDSRPCSGAEHLISHALDNLNYGTGLHGENVGLATLLCLELRSILGLESLPTAQLTKFKQCFVKRKFSDIDVTKEQLLHAVEKAPTMRNRITFLSDFAFDSDKVLQAAKDLL